MAEVRTYVKTGTVGRQGDMSVSRTADGSRVRVDYRESSKELLTSQLMSDAEATSSATAILEKVQAPSIPSADVTPPAAASLTGSVGDGSVALQWQHSGDDVDRWEVWLNNSWMDQLPATARTWSRTGLAPGVPVTVRIVAYDAAGNYANSSPITLTPSGPSGVIVVPGSSIPLSEPAGWRRLFQDDFNSPIALGQFPVAAPKWGAYPASWMGTMKNSYYDAPNTVSIHDGAMDIWCHTKDGRCLTAAPFPRLPQDPAVEIGPTSQHAGGSYTDYLTRSARVAVRVKVTPMPGYKTAWLFWPGSDVWPRDGEIDLPEGDARPGARVTGFMHRQNGVNERDQDFFDGGILYADGQFHIYVIEWRAGESCQFFRDDLAGPRWTNRVPSTPMRYVMQTESELSGIIPAPDVQGHVYCDWITYAVAA